MSNGWYIFVEYFKINCIWDDAQYLRVFPRPAAGPSPQPLDNRRAPFFLGCCYCLAFRGATIVPPSLFLIVFGAHNIHTSPDIFMQVYAGPRAIQGPGCECVWVFRQIRVCCVDVATVAEKPRQNLQLEELLGKLMMWSRLEVPLPKPDAGFPHRPATGFARLPPTANNVWQTTSSSE